MYTYPTMFGFRLAAFDEMRRQIGSDIKGLGGSSARGRASGELRLTDTGEAYVLIAALPGLSRQDLELSVTRDELTLSGERRIVPPEGFETQVRERPDLRLQRTLRFPEPVDTENVTASLTNGLLTVTAPKVPEARPRKVEVSIH